MKAQLNRRDFLTAMAGAAVGSTAIASHSRAAESQSVGTAARVPDTLDLAERGRLGLSALTKIMDPEHHYTNFDEARFYCDPPYMSLEMVYPPQKAGSNEVTLAGNEMWGKHVEALLRMRIMSGSDQNAERDTETLEGMVSCIHPDNLYWKTVGIIQGDEAIISEDAANAPLYGQSRVMLALLDEYKFDKNPRWLKLAQRLVNGFASVAVYKDDYAYYPDDDTHSNSTLCIPRTGWKSKEEPAGWSCCQNIWHYSNSCVQLSYGGIVRALCKLYTLSGDEESLEFARKLVKFMTKPRMWQPEGEPKAVVGAEHAHFEGHIHSTCFGLWGLLDFAEATNDAYLKTFVRDGYEYARNFGIARIGLFGEGCGVGDMVSLAVRLSEMNVGDYWEDVDQYVRNHLVEIQLLRPDLVKPLASSGTKHKVEPWETSQEVIERNVGAIFDDATHPTAATPGGIYCCTFNALIGYYYAWKSIVEWTDGAVQVNLLLNRRSPWLDVDSYLPYEGKVVIRNKTARELCVRIPRWVDQRAVKVAIRGRESKPFWVGRYVDLGSVAPGDVALIEFPIVESTETYENGFQDVSFPGHIEETCIKNRPGQMTQYRFRLKGNTVVDVTPRDERPGYPLYQRNDMRDGTKAPMREGSSYVATKMV